MTALYFPEGVKAADLLPRLGKRGVVVAGGLLGSIKGAFLLGLASQSRELGALTDFLSLRV